ncbi:MAG: lytic transglycosylase domain-containing protein, partial [Bradyrhizobium sp.]
DNAAYLSSFPDSRAVTPAAAMSPTDLKTASLPQAEPRFRSLFQAGDRTQPISPAVQELWGRSSSPTPVASVPPSLSGHMPEVRAPGRLDLFSDRDGTFSG